MVELVSEIEITDALAKCEDEELCELVNRLVEERDELVSELEEIRTERDAIEDEVKPLNGDAFNVLRSVRDWFDNVILHKRPMTDPRAIWKQVERALEQ